MTTLKANVFSSIVFMAACGTQPLPEMETQTILVEDASTVHAQSINCAHVPLSGYWLCAGAIFYNNSRFSMIFDGEKWLGDGKWTSENGVILPFGTNTRDIGYVDADYLYPSKPFKLDGKMYTVGNRIKFPAFTGAWVDDAKDSDGRDIQAISWWRDATPKVFR